MLLNKPPSDSFCLKKQKTTTLNSLFQILMPSSFKTFLGGVIFIEIKSYFNQKYLNRSRCLRCLTSDPSFASLEFLASCAWSSAGGQNNLELLSGHELPPTLIVPVLEDAPRSMFSIGLRSEEDGGIFMMPIAASDADVFLAGCDGSLPGVHVFLGRKTRSFLYHGRKWSVRKSKYIEGHFHTIREQPALSPWISPKHDFTNSLLMLQPC